MFKRFSDFFFSFGFSYFSVDKMNQILLYFWVATNAILFPGQDSKYSFPKKRNGLGQSTVCKYISVSIAVGLSKSKNPK